MQLLALTPAEIAFLGAPAAEPDSLGARLTRKLALTLTARLQLPVQAHIDAATGFVPAPGTPSWQPDAALATLWLDDPATLMPPALAWQFTTELGSANLAVQLPLQPTDMTRWAQEVIQHGH